MEYAVWNTLHDGSIRSVEGRIPGDVTLTVEIRYLCGELPTSTEHLVVRLRQCTKLEYHPFEGEPVANLDELGTRDVKVLSAELESGGVSVACVDGFLKLAYGQVEAHLAEGAPVSQEELEAAAERYWSKWAERNARE